MDNNESLFFKTKKLLTNEHHPENNYIKNTFNTYNTYTHHPFHSNLNVNNSNSYLLNNKSNIQMNNKRILNINQLLRQEKEKIEKILSPIRPEIKREEISHNEYQITTTMNQLNKIKTSYNINCLQVNNEFIQLKNKKNKLILVYNSLYNFKQILLNKEKELKKKEQKISKKENEIKMKESLIKNKFGSFNNYINYESENLMNKFKNLKNYHQKREDELFIREEKIKEYEITIKNIIETKEKQNKEKIKECIDLGNNLEKNLKNEKEKQIVQDIEIIEQEKEKIEKEKKLLQFQKELIEKEKIENMKFKKINQNKAKKLKQKEKEINESEIIINKKLSYFDKGNNNTFDSQMNNNNSYFGNFYKNNKSYNMNNIHNNKKKSLIPIGLNYNSARYKYSNPFILNNSNRDKKEDSFFHDSIYKNNYSSIKMNDDSLSQNYKINNSYVHDNIYLLKNKSNSNSRRFSKIIPIPSNASSSRKNRDIRKIENEKLNLTTNRTLNLDTKTKLNLNTTNESSIVGKDENSKSKYLEIKSDFNETFSEINSKIFETEKALQKIQNQERKIKIIKDKLDKKSKISS